jgi:hypothetical protein
MAQGGAGGTIQLDAPLDSSVRDLPAEGLTADAPGTCSVDKDCPTQSPLCMANRCAKCASDTDCVGRTGLACAANGTCVACTANKYCTGAAATCDTTANQCVGCVKRSDCSGACQTCTSGVCTAVKNQDDPGVCAGTCDATGACKSKQGQVCQGPADCASGTYCVDGYCCNSACTGSCQACDIPGLVGTCSNVSTGAPHGNHSPCGSDVSCFGTCLSGICSYASKACGQGPTCSGTDYVGQSMCSGGACVKPAVTSCGNGLACTGTACPSQCSGATGCLSTHYCAGSVCTPKKGEGAICAAAAECTSGSCGGRCCKAGISCTCPQPKPGNLLANPGFDSDLSGWNISAYGGGPPESSQRTTDDATGCPYSGSVRIGSYGSEIYQCIAVTPSTNYEAGIQWKAADPTAVGGGIHCQGFLYSGVTCPDLYGDHPSPDFSDVYDQGNVGFPVNWSGYGSANQGLKGTFFTSTYSKLVIGCLIGGDTYTDVLFDMWYVTPVPPGGY